MKLDPARLVGWVISALLLVLIVQQTTGALRDSGVWVRPRRAAQVASPYAALESLAAAAARAPAEAPLRDPFTFGRATAPAPARPATIRQPAKPTEPPRPQLTAIVWLENNPSATIRWNGKDRTVQVSTLFDEFRVRSITREQVILERGGETLVLQLPRKGD
jgi:hypothetical protein